MRIRTLPTLFLIFCSCFAFSNDDASVTRINIMRSYEKNCVAMRLPVGEDEVEIIFNKSDIDKFISSKPSGWKTEAERIHLIYADRAKIIIGNLTTTKNTHGCYETTKITQEAVYFAVYYLEIGKAALFNQDKKPMKYVFKSGTEYGNYGLYDENKNIFYINPPVLP